MYVLFAIGNTNMKASLGQIWCLSTSSLTPSLCTLNIVKWSNLSNSLWLRINIRELIFISVIFSHLLFLLLPAFLEGIQLFANPHLLQCSRKIFVDLIHQWCKINQFINKVKIVHSNFNFKLFIYCIYNREDADPVDLIGCWIFILFISMKVFCQPDSLEGLFVGIIARIGTKCMSHIQQ